MIAHRMRWCLDINPARHFRVVVDEHLFPRHEDIVAQHHGIAFVILGGKRVIELVAKVLAERLARPQGQARRAAGHGTGYGFGFAAIGDGKQVSDPQLIGIYTARGQHLHA